MPFDSINGSNSDIMESMTIKIRMNMISEMDIEERLLFDQLMRDNDGSGDQCEILDERHEMVIKEATPGYCYVKFLSILPSFPACDPGVLREVIENGRDTYGMNAPFPDVVLFLLRAEDALSSSDPSCMIRLVPRSIEGLPGAEEAVERNDSSWVNAENVPMVQTLMRSRVKFGFCEISGVAHLTNVQYPPCSCEEGVQMACQHGWSPRFLFVAFQERRIGASQEFDLNELFSDAPAFVQKPLRTTCDSIAEESPSSFDFDEFYESADDETNCPTPRLGFNDVQPLRTRNDISERRDSVAEEYRSRIDDQNNLLEKLMSREMRNPTQESRGFQMKKSGKTESLAPRDSSSVISRYERNYMPQGTILQVGRKVDNSYSEFSNSRGHESSVVMTRGFMMTNDLQKKKEESDSRITGLNGLANPFRNDRLNFLMHLHTALDGVSGREVSHYDMLKQITQVETSTPTDELAKQVVLRTFDLRDCTVVSNPFKLPFIEVGMLLSDSCLSKCFYMLEAEYKMLWFNNLKCLKVPEFHSEFSRSKERKLSSRSQEQAWTSSTHRPRERKPSGSSGKKSRTLLGF